MDKSYGSKNNLLRTVLLTGLLVGTLDGVAAIVHFKLNGGENPAAIAKFIASGVFGMSAFNGGTGIVLMGTLFHYIIALIWTALFFLVYPRIGKIRLNRYVTGVIYGVIIWVVMNLVVLPLSNTPPGSRDLMRDSIGMTILIAAVGLPIALIQTRKVLKRESSSPA